MNPLRWLVQIIYGMVPKRRTAVLNGRPDYCDDVLALETALHKTDLRKVVILCWSREEARARSRYRDISPRTVVVAKRTVRGFWYAMTAKYIFFTHSWATRRCPKSVESVNVWHGMPVKRVGWMTDAGPSLPVVKYAVATSPFWAPVIQDSLRPTVETFISGMPRNDRLVLGDRGVLRALGYPPESGVRMIAWLPTYRSGWRKGGMRGPCTHLLDLSDEGLQAINDTLARHNALLVIKPHPLVKTGDALELSHIRYLSDGWLKERGFTLHELLGESSALVTDVSSAYVDYLVLDRPIVHHFPDLEEYGLGRGYSFEPIQDYLAGPVVSAQADLAGALATILEGRDTHAAQRRRTRDLFHDPLGGSAAERLLSSLGLAIKSEE